MKLSSIFQNRNLTFLWLGQVVSQCGDSIYQIGLLWLTLELSGSESVTGLVAMAYCLPAIALSLFAGVTADRFHRKKIMLTADAARTLLILLVPAIYYLRGLGPTVLGINAFAIAIAATFFIPARDSLIPQIVPKEGLIRANSLVQTSWQFSMLFGPILAAFLLRLVGKIHLFTVDSLTYFISFLFILFIKTRDTSNDIPKKGIGFGEIKEGLIYVLKEKVILPLLLITVADNILIMGPAIVGTPVFVREVLKLGADSYAQVLMCYAIGTLLGSAFMIAFGVHFKKGKLLLIGMVLDGITFIPLYFAKNLISMEIISIIHSIAIPMLTVSRSSLIQEIVPPEMTGRVFALINMAVVGMSSVSAGLTGFALEWLGAPMVFLIIGVGGGLCGVIGWIWAKELRVRE